MNREYFADGLPDLSDPSKSISFDADTIANALVNIYQKKYGNGRELEPTLFEKTKEILGGAVNKGWNAGGSPATDRNSAFIDALRHNADVFSAFRTHKMQSDIAAQLLDSKGNLKPFGQFVKDVKPYVTHQNRAWLQTEYDTAVLRAHQAADWKQFEDEKDVFPNLEWLPSTSPHPGEDHRPYWGTVLPIDHKFWDDHRPGDRWNCKCRLRNTDKPATAVPAETVVKNLQPSKGLESNPGKTGEIFSNNHPYYPENCGKCPFNKGVGRLFAALVGKQKNCGKCVKVEAFVNEPKNGKQEKENYNKRVERKISGKELEVLKKTWNINNESGKYLTPELINNSAASGFNFLGLEQLIVSIVKSVNADVNINKLLTFTKKGVVRYSIKSSVVKLSRQFYYENDERIVEHLRITVTKEYRENGIAQKITAFLLGQYSKMNLDKLKFVAGKTHGGYYWAKKGFYAKNKKTALSAVRKHKSKCKRIIKQYYKKRQLKEDAPFPMDLIANKSWGKEALMGGVWESEMILH